MRVLRVWVAALCACAAVMGCNAPVVTTDDAARSDAGRDSSIPVVDGGVDGGSDPCTGRTLCETEGVSCDGDSLVTCATDSDGCLVEATEDCGLADEICDATSGTAACIDPCSLIPEADRCTADARTCNSDSLEVCAADSNGCYVLARTDCAAMPGGVCDDSGTMAVCALPADPCAGIADACTTAGTTCTAEVLTTCAPNAFGCLVATTNDCAARAGGTCEDATAPAACMFTGDPCATVTECAAAGTACVGPELVTCAADAYGCLVETRTDCTDAAFGFCDTAAAPAMCATGATDPCMGVTECDPAGARTCSDSDTIALCAANALGCYVPSTMDCTTGDVCDAPAGAMAMCVDACSLVETCTTATSCDGDTLVTCTPDTNGCLVETDTTECLFSCGTTGTSSSCVDTVCPGSAPVVLNCDSGTFNGTTVGGTTEFDGNYGSCASGTSYSGAEQVVRFSHAGTGRVAVTVVATRGSASSADFDLFVMNGGDGTAACTSATTCLDSGTGSTAVETVEFVGVAGETSYLVYDIYTSTTATTDYTLAVTCTPIVCGDGARGAGETCDDSNMVAGDGCSDTCVIEPGFACTGTPSTCARTCGNGIVGTGETCDDMDRDPGDGCSATCQTETGYSCSGAPSTCVVIPPGGVCATAIPVTGNSGLTGTTVGGGPGPTGTGCSSSGGGPAFYYAVTIPAATRVDVQLTPSFDMVLQTIDACGATSCSARTDSSPERLSIANPTAAPITKFVVVNGFSTTATGTYSISFTYFTSVCGNGIVQAGEGCDDGGTVDGNGCSATCQVESGYRCSGAPSTCTALGPNPSCATAIDLGSSGVAVDQAVSGGGDVPTGTGCSRGTGPVLYYSVTVPPGSSTTFTATPDAAPAWDPTLRVIADCSATACLSTVDSGGTGGAETITIPNPGATPLTRFIAVGAYTATALGTFDVLVTSAALGYTAVPLACADMATGTTVTTSDDDDGVSTNAALPFAFSLLGTSMSHYTVSTNGFAQLHASSAGTGTASPSNSAIPDTDTPNGFIAPFWDDLVVGGAIRVLTTGTAPNRTFVVEWSGMTTYGTSGSNLRFQAHIQETGVVELHYCSMVGTGTRATGDSAAIGMENAAGTGGVQVSYYTGGAATTGTAYRITP